MLSIKNLKLKRDGKELLRGVDLEVGESEIHSVIGPNGAGKSTLAYLLMGIGGYSPEEGSVYFNNEDITQFTITQRSKRGITLAWQEPARFEGLTVYDYLSIGAGGVGKVSENTLRHALEMVDLSPDKYLYREVSEALSGGERKRIEMASILTMKPKLVILDEPDSGIDFVSLKDIVALIQDLKKNGSSVLVITHRKEIALASDKASLMCDGMIVKTGSPAEINDFFMKKCKPCDVETYDLKGE
ncbi:MAG TPA: ABC transporter ATP-binding protein [Methanosarcinaceae archaeon]|nr:ABC transporter ATP-binding protein [Methanosarcinaceae archaeon]